MRANLKKGPERHADAEHAYRQAAYLVKVFSAMLILLRQKRPFGAEGCA
jgi:hypothetical protein